jgi:predicted metal-binding protein
MMRILAVAGLCAACHSVSRTIQFVAPRTGWFTAELAWLDRDVDLALLTSTRGRCCKSPLSVTFQMEDGTTYLFSVSDHAARNGSPDAPFEVTTSIFDVPSAQSQ